MDDQTWMKRKDHSVGSLPGPFVARDAVQAQLDALALQNPAWVGPRVLDGRWRQAMRAERALGLILWIGLAAVIVIVSV